MSSQHPVTMDTTGTIGGDCYPSVGAADKSPDAVLTPKSQSSSFFSSNTGRKTGHFRGDSTVSAVESTTYYNQQQAASGHSSHHHHATQDNDQLQPRRQHQRSFSHSQHPCQHHSQHNHHYCGHHHHPSNIGHGHHHETGRRPSTSSYHHHHQQQNRGHKRTKSAGTSVKDLSIFMTTGLYAHQPIGAFRSIEYGFNNLSQAEGLAEDVAYSCRPLSLSRSSSRKRRRSQEEDHQADDQSKHPSLETASSDDFLSPLEENELCGILSFRPLCLQRFATIQVFVFLSCILVTLNQALSSGYFNSVITTIEKRFDIPSKMTGLIASTFEIGNLITVIFVSYFGTHRHIPKWIAKGIVVTGIGSLVFSLAHFVKGWEGNGGNPLDKFNVTGAYFYDDNICHIPSASLNSLFVDRTRYVYKVLCALFLFSFLFTVR